MLTCAPPPPPQASPTSSRGCWRRWWTATWTCASRRRASTTRRWAGQTGSMNSTCLCAFGPRPSACSHVLCCDVHNQDAATSCIHRAARWRPAQQHQQPLLGPVVRLPLPLPLPACLGGLPCSIQPALLLTTLECCHCTPALCRIPGADAWGMVVCTGGSGTPR